MLGYEGSDAYHLRLETPDEADVLHQMVQSLSGAAHHDAGAGLIAGFFEPLQTLQPVFS